jgi:hypothetical protein
MDQEQKKQVTEVIANGILNTLNINGIIEATKAYSMKMAQERIEVMSKEELAETLEKIEKAIEEQKVNQENLSGAEEQAESQAAEVT